MELILQPRVVAFLLSCWLIFSVALSVEGVRGNAKVRAVNLGGWLVVEGWIKPSLFDDIPNPDMLDGTQVQFKSVTLHKFVSADNGGGSNVTVDRDEASGWETFRLWRVSDKEFQLRSFGGQFLTRGGEEDVITATTESPSTNDTFVIERLHNSDRVHIKYSDSTYIQASSEDQLTADYQGKPGWDDNSATFEMKIITNNLHGDYQLANGYGHDQAKRVLEKHWNSFITVDDFEFLNGHGINAVRIPVGWWIAFDPDPPAPFIGGTLDALDNAFSWALSYEMKCIIDLHAAPGSQNGMEHSASRDGSIDWPNSQNQISKTLDVIEFLISRYANHPALLGIELLNEPMAASVPLDVLVSFYEQGYKIVRNYSSTAYVIVCQRIGNADPMELYQANIGHDKLVLDLHYYNLFDAYFNNLSVSDNVQYIYKSRKPQIQQLNGTNGPLLFIGEWVNEWDVTNGSQQDYQNFGRAQLDVYDNASFGWAYWTLKNNRQHWDFEWSIKNKYLEFSSHSSRFQAFHVFLFFGLAWSCLCLHQIL